MPTVHGDVVFVIPLGRPCECLLVRYQIKVQLLGGWVGVGTLVSELVERRAGEAKKGYTTCQIPMRRLTLETFLLWRRGKDGG